ncbi:DUF6254 family protein [Oceanobacillus chungangensis]|nr:DUF6254 family protein [Oceanobacillus chungangensis]
MSKSKRRQERERQGKKQSQNPHGKVKSFEELAADAGKDESL